MSRLVHAQDDAGGYSPDRKRRFGGAKRTRKRSRNQRGKPSICTSGSFVGALSIRRNILARHHIHEARASVSTRTRTHMHEPVEAGRYRISKAGAAIFTRTCTPALLLVHIRARAYSRARVH
eukprot:6172633-Pleurochrysis_carterae.AAC.1